MKELSTAKLLAILWVLYLFNILYADALSLMQTNAQVVTTQANQETIEQLLTDEMLLGAAIIIDKATGKPSVEGKESIVIESKMIEEGKVDVVEQDGKVIFIKGTG